MSDETNDNRNTESLGLDDPDRLPWLETADGYEYDEGASPLKVAAMVLGGLVLLAAIVGGIYWAQRYQNNAQTGKGELIAAPAGDYKAKPDEAGGKTFEGEGDSAFAASEGKKTGATIAPTGKTADAKAPATGPATAATAPKAANAAAPDGAVMVQLGAFGDSAKAEAAWAAFGKRFGFLSGTNRRIATASVEGGRKIFRLQAVTANAAAAQQLCAKLKAAGENCLIVR
ncbi:SPOR domain-containing protein [Sphingorhabdus sp. IMCC26285]|uniref:SPOR domain-containing protein n=1 Tax=Sphingorhabdus profundilacus TaxID=2509718 RepID=A0A6I4LZK5_9SPHN|nr:SPOR domain-containing protein [Sphingorhabdus profundilacus]MVZ97354.1 SPOR domain-containing protein [Sphingorhabdus profundilacus]